MKLVFCTRGTFHLAFVKSSFPIVIGLTFANYFFNSILLVNLKAQHAVHRQGVDNLVQIEHLHRVPTLFEVLHQGIDFIAIKQLDELTAQTTVAMLAAERAFVFLDQQGGLIGHFTEFPLAFRFLDVDNGS